MLMFNENLFDHITFSSKCLFIPLSDCVSELVKTCILLILNLTSLLLCDYQNIEIRGFVIMFLGTILYQQKCWNLTK